MAKFDIINKIKGLPQTVSTGFQSNKPAIYMVLGTGTAIGAIVWACVQTRKLDDILEEHEETMNKIKKLREESEKNGQPENFARETTLAYLSTIGKCARLYAGPTVLFVASQYCYHGAYRDLNKKNVALAGMVKTMDTGFKQYRNRVRDRVGDEVEKEIATGTTTKQIEETVVDENGEEKTVTNEYKVADPNVVSPYGRYFTRHNKHWDRSPDAVKIFFLSEQNYMNDQLKGRALTNAFGVGTYTMNEAFERLDFDAPEDGSGLYNGWIYDEKNPYGDNYIELDVTPCMIPGDTGRLEQAYYVEFNFDGNIAKELHERDLRRKALAG